MKTKMNIAQTISGAVTKNRKRLLGFGIFSIILGLIGTFMATVFTMASMVFFGVLVIIAGAFFFIEGFSSPNNKTKAMYILISLLYLVSGGIMITYPEVSAVSFTFIMAALFIAIGIVRIVIGFKVKPETGQWAWVVVSGLLSVALGIMIYMQWPSNSSWIIGLFISVELVVQGIVSIIFAQRIQDTQNEVEGKVNDVKENIKNTAEEMKEEIKKDAKKAEDDLKEDAKKAKEDVDDILPNDKS